MFLRRAMVIAALLAGVMWLSTAPASAHTGFESSDPTDGAVIDEPIEQVVLRFSGPAQPAGEGFVILDSAGVVRSPDTVTSDVEQQVWTLGFDPPLAGGAVGFRWTVQAPDAHPIEGAFSFTVSAPVIELTDPEAGSRPATTAVPAPPAASESVPPEATATAGAATDLEADGEAAAGQGDPEVTGQLGASGATPSAAEDLDAFLSQSEVGVPNAEGVGAFGRLLGFVGTMLGIGGLVFAAVVVHDHRRDTSSVLKAVRYSAAIVVVGTAIDLAAHLAVANNGWGDSLGVDGIESVAASAYGLAVGLRVAAGLLLFAAARMTHRQLSYENALAADRELVFAGAGGSIGASVGSLLDDPRFGAAGELHGSVVAEDPDSPMAMPVSPAIVVSVLVLLASFTFDGHTVTEGNRWVTGAVDMIHVVAGSIWAGGVVAFAVVLWRRYRRRERLNGLEMALRFSVIAGAALAVAGVAGTILAAIILDAVSELWTTPWGRLLIAKTFVVSAAASLGTYNHFVVIPWLNQHPDDDLRSVRLRNTATGEALLLIAVITVTAFLVGASSQP